MYELKRTFGRIPPNISETVFLHGAILTYFLLLDSIVDRLLFDKKRSNKCIFMQQ